MREPTWHNLKIEPIDYQAHQLLLGAEEEGGAQRAWTRSIPRCGKTFEKLGIPLEEQKLLAGVAVDAVFDSVSVATTFREKLAELGIIFCSFSEAVKDHPELVKKYLGSVVPYTDNFYATLNSAVFSDGSFVYIPKGVRCPMELSTYFRINAKNTGQFERTLIVADEGALRELPRGLHGADARRNQLHAAVVELVALDNATIKYSTIQNWYPGDKNGKGGIYNFVTKRGKAMAQREDHVDAGRDRLGDHLEVSELHPAGRQLGRRVLLGGDDEQLAAGRHRHEDDSHRQEHAQHDRLEGHFGRPRPEHVSRRGEDRQERARRAQLLAVRLAAHRRQVRRAHVPVSRDQEHDGQGRARGVDVEDRRGPDLLLPPARHLDGRRREHDRERLLQGSLPRAADGVRGRGAEAARRSVLEGSVG